MQDESIPLGLCGCGCGQETTPGKRWRQNHHSRPVGIPRWIAQDCGYGSFCWVWQWGRNGSGYGRCSSATGEVLAHRHYYALRHGTCPPTLDHLCRNRACVNPAHLEPCGRGENVRRGSQAKLTWDDVDAIRASDYGPTELGKRFGVSAHTISSVRAGRSWVRTPNERKAP